MFFAWVTVTIFKDLNAPAYKGDEELFWGVGWTACCYHDLQLPPKAASPSGDGVGQQGLELFEEVSAKQFFELLETVPNRGSSQPWQGLSTLREAAWLQFWALC